MNGIVRAVLFLTEFIGIVLGEHVMSSWSRCSVTCGYGVQTRHRIDLRSSEKEAYLENRQRRGDEHTEHRQCVIACPVDGVWGPWHTSSACSQTCGGGLQALTRLCDHPAPLFGGHDCVGHTNGSQPCNTFHCPIDGGWSDYHAVTDCSTTCGDGVQTLHRTCSNPTPSNNGTVCEGMDTMVQGCHKAPCPSGDNLTSKLHLCTGGSASQSMSIHCQKYGGNVFFLRKNIIPISTKPLEDCNERSLRIATVHFGHQRYFTWLPEDIHPCDKVGMLVAVFSHSSVHHSDAHTCADEVFFSSRAPLLKFCSAPSNTTWTLGHPVTGMRCEDRVMYTPISMSHDQTGQIEYGIYSGCHNGTIEVISQNCTSPLKIHHVLEADATGFRFLTW